MKTSYAARLEFQCTNNIAEYKAILSWRKLKAMVVKMEVLEVDSQVITCHVDKSSNARNLTLEKYLDIVWRMEESFEGFSMKNIPRGDNEHADLLAKSVAQGLPLPMEVFLKSLKTPSVELMERVVLIISLVHNED
jgi:ribonuclease HI